MGGGYSNQLLSGTAVLSQDHRWVPPLLRTFLASPCSTSSSQEVPHLLPWWLMANAAGNPWLQCPFHVPAPVPSGGWLGILSSPECASLTPDNFCWQCSRKCSCISYGTLPGTCTVADHAAPGSEPPPASREARGNVPLASLQGPHASLLRERT